MRAVYLGSVDGELRALPSNHRPRRLFAALPLLMVVIVGSGTSTRSAASEDASDITVTRVLIDVVVTDKKGVPLPGVSSEEFRLVIDGHNEPIEAFEDHCTAKVPGGDASVVAAADSGARAFHDKRQIVMFFDMSHMMMGARKRGIRIATEFVDEMMTPDDRVMILAFSKGLYVIAPFTNDRQLLLSRLETMTGDRRLIDTAPFEEENTLQYLSRNSGSPRNSEQMRAMTRMVNGIAGDCLAEARMAETAGARTMRALANAMPAFVDVPGRKALMLFSETLRGDPAEAYRAACGAPDSGGLSLEFTVRPETDDLIQQANLAEVSFYPMHTGGMSAGPTTVLLRGALDFQKSAAIRTGGEAFLIMRDPLKAFERAGRDLSCHYVLVYRPTETLRAGRHGVEVFVSRPKTRTRYRESFVTETPAEAGEREMMAVLSNPGLYRDLKVEGHGYTLADTGKKETAFLVQASVPMASLGMLPVTEGEGRGKVSLRGAVLSSKPSVDCEFEDSLEFEGPMAEAAGPRRAGIQALCKLAPGEHEIVVAARDEVGGALGTFWGKVQVAPARERKEMKALLWASSGDDPWVKAASSQLLPAGSDEGGGDGDGAMLVRGSLTLDAGEPGVVTYVACRERGASKGEIADDPAAFSVRIEGPSSLILPARAANAEALSPCDWIEAEIPRGALVPGTYLAIPEAPAPWHAASVPVKLRVESR